MFKNVWLRTKKVLFSGDECTEEYFLQACERNDEPIIRKYLSAGINPNCRNEYQSTALHIAVYGYYPKLVNILLNVPNININAQDSFQRTPLNLACVKNNIIAVELLIQFKADVNMPDKFGYTPLHNAVKFERHQITKIMLETDDIIVDSENIFAQTPLYSAIIENTCKHCAKLLVEHNADVDRKNDKIMPILLEAALSCQTSSQLEVIEYFLQLGASVDIQDRESGRTALHIVAITGYLPLAILLTDRGANIRTRDYLGKTAIDVAIMFNQVPIVAFLQFKLEK